MISERPANLLFLELAVVADGVPRNALWRVPSPAALAAAAHEGAMLSLPRRPAGRIEFQPAEIFRRPRRRDRAAGHLHEAEIEPGAGTDELPDLAASAEGF